MKTLWDYIRNKPLTLQFELVQHLRKAYPQQKAEKVMESDLHLLPYSLLENVATFLKVSYNDLVS